MIELQKVTDQQTPSHKVTWDLTINVPTLLALVVTTVTGISWVLGKYQSVESTVASNRAYSEIIRRDVDRIDSETKAIRSEQSSKIDALRAEVRQDLRDVNAKLDQLLVRDDK